jgi:hypothetical protein
MRRTTPSDHSDDDEIGVERSGTPETDPLKFTKLAEESAGKKIVSIFRRIEYKL